MIWVLGIFSSLWTHILTGELSTELRNKRQSSDEYIEDRKVVCYYANWAVYRQGNAKFTPQNINPYLCTHLIYAFGGLGKDDNIVPFDEYQDIEKGGYGRFAALKTYNKDLKTMLAIGGWNEGSKRFSPLVADPDRRQVFIKSALRFLRQYNFDGLDLDWEYPTQRAGGRPQDRENYAILIEEMREAFEREAKKTGKERLQISMAVPASLEYAGKGYDIDKLDKNLDFFNLLTYDYHSAHEPAVNHHSPLYRPDDWSEFDFRKELNIDATIKFYLKNGASRDKLVLGIPTYGRSYTLANPDAHEISSPATGPGEEGTGTKEDGYLAYYEICEKILEEGWDIVTPYPGIMGPYAHKNNQWVGFDDVDIAVEKAFYVAEEELGGIMFWTIDNDDFRGSCGKTPYPLIESAKEAMYSVQSSVKTKTSVSVSTSEQTRVTRLRLTPQELANLATSPGKSSKKKLERPSSPRRQESPRSFSTSVTTPAPPTTPRSGPAFKCKNEGFFAHPSNCKKYYWCLDTPSQGMVAHTFSCPQGLFFNQITDGCDFLRNVDCGDKAIKETEPKKAKTAEKDNIISDEEDDEDDVEDPKSLKDILEIVKAAGGVEGLEKQIEEEEVAKKEEEDRRVRISSKTRSRLSQLLNRGQQPKSNRGGESKDQAFVSRPKISIPRLTTQTPASTRSSANSRSDASRNSLLSRLASKRRNLSPRLQNRIKPNFSREELSTEELESNQKIMIVGAHLEPEEPEEQALHLGVFKPKAGIREKLRETLHTVLEHEMAERGKDREEEEPSTIAPLSTVTISRNTRIQEARQRESVKSFVGRQRKLPTQPHKQRNEVSQDSNRYVTIQRAGGTTPTPDFIDNSINQSSEGGEDVNTDESSSPFRPTVSDNLVSTDGSTQAPFFPTFVPVSTDTSNTTPGPVIVITQATQEQEGSGNFQSENQLRDSQSFEHGTIRLGSRDQHDKSISREQSLFKEVQENIRSSEVPQRSSRPFVGRPLRPVPSRNQDAASRLRSSSIKQSRSRSRAPLAVTTTKPTTRVEAGFFSPSEPEQLASPVQSSRVLTAKDLVDALVPAPTPHTRIARPQVQHTRRKQSETKTHIPVSKARTPVNTFDKIVPQKSTQSRDKNIVRTELEPTSNIEFEYEYYYDYLDDDNDKPNTEYDLVPLANKVRILSDGLPHCLDVGVFPHPFSCKKFVNCFRNPGTGIVGSIYQCPSYLAFDPVGGRCNWVTEIVCAASK